MPNSRSVPPGNANLRIGVLSSSSKKKTPTPRIRVIKNSNETNPANPQIGSPGKTAWHSRGYLPHFDPTPGNANLRIGVRGPSLRPSGVIQHITFHLADSLPKAAILRLESELKFLPADKQDAERRKRIDAYIDAGHGSCILQKPDIAVMVQESLFAHDSQRYRLIAWVVMPNHVHVLIEPINDWTVAKIVASWKRFTATRIRAGQPDGPLWHREYWDRYIRNEKHFHQAIAYIHKNPVTAQLAANPESYPWSSAFPGNAKLRIGESFLSNSSTKKPNPANAEIGAPGSKK